VLPFKLVFHPKFNVDLGPQLFAAHKYRLVRERLLQTGVAAEADFVAPSPATEEDALRVHSAEYLRKIESGDLTSVEARTLEVPWSRSLVEAFFHAAGGAILAGRLARRERCAILIGGGFHHAYPDHGEGFCLLHDVAIAAAALRASRELVRLAIVDLDVHQGNGTGAILGQHKDSFTVSLHQEHNYPVRKSANTIDIGLEDGTNDAAYLTALEEPLRRALAFRPELLFYLAGADPYEHDTLGGLALSFSGLKERDRRVFEAARAAGVPVAVTLAGGYATNPADTVTIHANTVQVAAEVFG